MSIDGHWVVTIKGPMGAMRTTLSVKTNGAAFTGTQSGQGQSSAISSGSIEGEKISWTNEVSAPVKMKLEFAGVVSGNEMSGKVKAGFMGSYPFTGAREG